ncbi:MAG: N-acetyl-gamma-glutamyl-phosphate reductase [Polyangiaceae bacterium]
MVGQRVMIVGASGYSGAVAARLVAAHPSLSLGAVTSDKLSGQEARRRLGASMPAGLTFSPNADALALSAEHDLVFLATPAEVSAKLAPQILATTHAKIVDLSGAFRLRSAEDYPRHYGFSHPSPELLDSAWYGLPELFGAPPPGTRLVSNPGCYPTATLLAIAPLVRAGLVEPGGIIVDAKSGVSGAGVQAKEEYSFVEIDEDLRAYKILGHQHTPEIARHLGRAANVDEPRLTFTPHLLPIRRGLMSTCYARPRAGVSAESVHTALLDVYTSSAFVDVVAPGEVTLKAVAGTNRARVGATANGDVVVALGSIDNLVKGAAGQALQNANLLLGLDETAGLLHLQTLYP